MRLYERQSLSKLCLGRLICMAENYAACVLDLIVEKFSEIFHIHLALIHVNDNCEAIELDILCARLRDRAYNVAELANARGLDKYSIGSVFFNNFF